MARPKGAKTVNRTPGVKLGRPKIDNPKPTRVRGIKKTRELKSPSEERGHSPFVAPGQVINPAGRPKKGESLTDILRTRLDEEIKTRTGSKIQIKKALVEKKLESALAGNQKSIEWIFDRVDGKAVQPVENTLQGPNGGPVEIKDTDFLNFQEISNRALDRWKSQGIVHGSKSS